MKRLILVFFAFALVLSLGCSAFATMPARDGLVELEGKVTYMNLEGGFYSLGGYRLVSDADLKPYLNANVRAKGYQDDSPSIFMVQSLVLTEIAVQNDTPLQDTNGTALQCRASVQGILLYNYRQKSFYIRQYNVQGEDLAPYFGKYVRVDGSVDKLGVLNAEAIATYDYAKLRQQVGDELFFATYHNARSRLKYALYAMVAVNGSIKKDNLYQKLAKQMNSEDGSLNLFVNGRKIFFAPDAAPIVKSSQPYAPVQPLCDAFGLFQAQTFAATNKIMLSKGDLNLVFELGKRTVFVNDKKFLLPTAIKAVHGQAMLPVRFICEQLGYKTLWLANGKVFAAFN